MEAASYLETLSKKFQKYFQVKKDKEIFDMKFNIYAQYTEVSGRTFITAKDIIDRFEVSEHCFVKVVEDLDRRKIESFSEFLKSLTVKFVKPHKEHRSTIITGVIVSEKEIGKDIETFIKGFKHSKYYKFYFHGYSDVRLVVVDLVNKKVIANKKGKEVLKVYLPTP